ncbi:MAG: hypothetical protein JSS86_11050 [Cyanobacteria bacterium SZAS LIN-2]|nr:hypothetical protein [Cyanobacteria bacterium SZAS LIN-3]MBS1996843.1 hypothetical protein [Cyanobacteria bacterium SZAS LIN-2]
MTFEILLAEEAHRQFNDLKSSKSKAAIFKAVAKALRLIAENPKHPGLNTHEYSSLEGPHGVKVYEAYAQNKTPGAYRIFFCYHPPKSNKITVIAITPHP